MARKYEMAGRVAAMQRTREAILDAVESFADDWFDEVTVADIARRAGVSQQTVVNHFGGKLQVYLACLRERWVPQIAELRAGVVPGDVASLVEAVVRDYEGSGDRTMRTIALAGRLEELRPVVAGGRRAHREFVERCLAPLLPRRGARRQSRLTLLAAVLDVTMWHQLRRDDGLDVDATREHLVMLTEAVLHAG